MRAEAFRLKDDGTWAKMGEAKGDQSLFVLSIGVELPLPKAYAKVTFS